MSTIDYIPPERDLEFYPAPPPVSTNPGPAWILEIGPGKGEFLLHSAQSTPQKNFVAVEIKKGRFLRISEKAKRLELNNLYMIRGDARECLPRIFPPNSFERIYILFPDPWPKKRHAKHRLLKPRLVSLLADLLQENGEVVSATDAGYYSEQIVEAFATHGGFIQEAIPSPFSTYFQKKWEKLGRPINYWSFKKNSTAKDKAMGSAASPSLSSEKG